MFLIYKPPCISYCYYRICRFAKRLPSMSPESNISVILSSICTAARLLKTYTHFMWSKVTNVNDTWQSKFTLRHDTRMRSKIQATLSVYVRSLNHQWYSVWCFFGKSITKKDFVKCRRTKSVKNKILLFKPRQISAIIHLNHMRTSIGHYPVLSVAPFYSLHLRFVSSWRSQLFCMFDHVQCNDSTRINSKYVITGRVHARNLKREK